MTSSSHGELKFKLNGIVLLLVVAFQYLPVSARAGGGVSSGHGATSSVYYFYYYYILQGPDIDINLLKATGLN